MITTTSKLTYVDILRKVKTDNSLQALGENVKRIRRTQRIDLVFEVRPGERKLYDLHKKIES